MYVFMTNLYFFSLKMLGTQTYKCGHGHTRPNIRGRSLDFVFYNLRVTGRSIYSTSDYIQRRNKSE